MEQNDKQKAEEAFIESCLLHDLKHNVCTDGIGGTECDGDCKYTKRFIINLNKEGTNMEEQKENKDKYEHKCRQCGRTYEEFNSDADKKEYFCCKACEFGY